MHRPISVNFLNHKYTRLQRMGLWSKRIAQWLAIAIGRTAILTGAATIGFSAGLLWGNVLHLAPIPVGEARSQTVGIQFYS